MAPTPHSSRPVVSALIPTLCAHGPAMPVSPKVKRVIPANESPSPAMRRHSPGVGHGLRPSLLSSFGAAGSLPVTLFAPFKSLFLMALRTSFRDTLSARRQSHRSTTRVGRAANSDQFAASKAAHRSGACRSLRRSSRLGADFGLVRPRQLLPRHASRPDAIHERLSTAGNPSGPVSSSNSYAGDLPVVREMRGFKCRAIHHIGEANINAI